jgi:hypothetical protein
MRIRTARAAWLTGLLLAASPAGAEVGDRSPEDLARLASCVLRGTVQRVYTTTETAAGFRETTGVAELTVGAIDKGCGGEELVYARFATREWVGRGPAPTTSYGHRGLPRPGQTVRVYLTRGADGGYDVVLPNGFAVLR